MFWGGEHYDVENGDDSSIIVMVVVEVFLTLLEGKSRRAGSMVEFLYQKRGISTECFFHVRATIVLIRPLSIIHIRPKHIKIHAGSR